MKIQLKLTLSIGGWLFYTPGRMCQLQALNCLYGVCQYDMLPFRERAFMSGCSLKSVQCHVRNVAKDLNMKVSFKGQCLTLEWNPRYCVYVGGIDHGQVEIQRPRLKNYTSTARYEYKSKITRNGVTFGFFKDFNMSSEAYSLAKLSIDLEPYHDPDREIPAQDS